MTDRLGRADLHIHTLASDGIDRDRRDPRPRRAARPTSTSSRSPTTSGSTPRSPRGRWPATAGSRSRSSSARRSRPSAATSWRCSSSGRSGRFAALRTTIAEIHEQGGLAIPAHPLVPYPLCAQGWVLRRLLADARPARPARRDRDVQPDDARAAVARPRRAVRRRARARRGRQQRRARARGDRHGLDDVPGSDRPTTCGRRSPPARPSTHGSFHGDRRPAVGTFGRAAPASTPRDARDERRAARVRRDGTGRDLGLSRRAHRPPRFEEAWPPARSTLGEAESGRMKIGLVSPVRLPAARRRDPARPVPVREPPPARPRRPDPDPATASSARPRATSSGSARASRCPSTARSGRSRCRRASCPRSATMLEREQFDLLHFHEPFVPFLSLDHPAPVDQRERRHVPRLRRLLARRTSSGSRVMHGDAARLHGRIAVSGAATPLHRSLLPGRVQGHPQRRRRRRASERPSRSRAGRTARRTSCSSAGSSRARACSTCSRRYRILRKTGSSAGSSSSAPGRTEREARRYVATRRPARASSSSAASATRRRPSCSGPRTSTSRRRPAASRSASSCSRRWPPGPPIVASDIHGYKGVVRRGREGLLVPPREPKELAAAIARLLQRRRAPRPRWARPAESAPRSSAGSA